MRFLGLMSGTSLDGIDVAFLEVDEFDPGLGGEEAGRGKLHVPRVAWRIPHFHTRPYTPEQGDEIRGALTGGGPKELARLHTRLGEWFAAAALELLERVGEPPQAVQAIGSHGQTIWHDPPRGEARGSSFQLGCPSTLAERTGIPVVSDFRARDLAAGGHGAPLVPWADAVFFTSEDRSRTLQNLGGMGNVTWLPPRGDPSPILAFDTGPGVALLNEAAALATNGAWSFDRDGYLARSGEVVEGVLARLQALSFFRQAPPRSTGREVFGQALVREAMEWLEIETGVKPRPGSPDEGWPGLLATLTALTAWSIGDSYRRWVLPGRIDEVYLMGGGARNPALREALDAEMAPIPVKMGDELGMDPDAREAACFGLLAWAHLRGLPANVPGATGAVGPRVLGSFTPGARP